MSMFYQIDHFTKSSGKRVNTTKRQVHWRWGIANKDKLFTGATGVRCRGCEHEVILHWSVASRKRLILLDGEEAHFSTGRRSERKFQYSWVSLGLGCHVFTVIAHGNPTMLLKPSLKQFDLLIDGKSCSNLPHLNEVGMFNLPAPEDVRYGTIICDQNSHLPQQVRNIEQKRQMNQTGLAPSAHSLSLAPVRKNWTTQALPLRRKSVSFSSDFANVDLLSAALPVHTNHYLSTYDADFKAVPDSNSTVIPPLDNTWSTTMDASRHTTQVDMETFENKENSALFQTEPKSTYRGQGFLGTLARRIQKNTNSSRDL